jgi:hypothetical protein
MLQIGRNGGSLPASQAACRLGRSLALPESRKVDQVEWSRPIVTCIRAAATAELVGSDRSEEAADLSTCSGIASSL